MTNVNVYNASTLTKWHP